MGELAMFIAGFIMGCGAALIMFARLWLRMEKFLDWLWPYEDRRKF